MIQKLKLSRWVSIITLIMFIIVILSLFFDTINYELTPLSIAFWTVLNMALFVCPIMVLLSLVDLVFNKDSDKKYGILLIIINIFLVSFTAYIAYHMFDNMDMVL